MKVVIHYGTPTITLEAPIEAVTYQGAKPILITGYMDNGREGDYGHWVQATGRKQKKNGEWYGNFQNLDVKIPRDVVELFKALNEK